MKLSVFIVGLLLCTLAVCFAEHESEELPAEFMDEMASFDNQPRQDQVTLEDHVDIVRRNSSVPARNSSGAPARNSAGSPPRNSAGSPPRNSAGAPPRNSAGSPPRNSAGSPPRNSAGSPPRNSAGSPPRNSVGGPAAGARVKFEDLVDKKCCRHMKKYNLCRYNVVKDRICYVSCKCNDQLSYLSCHYLRKRGACNRFRGWCTYTCDQCPLFYYGVRKS